MARQPRWQERQAKKRYDDTIKERGVSEHALDEHHADLDPSVWSPGLLSDYGAEMWAVCPRCRIEKNVGLGPLIIAETARRSIRAMTLRCQTCGGVGHTVVKWWSMAGKLCFYNLTTGEHQGAWKLLLRAPYPSRRATPDPTLPPLEPPKGYRTYEPEPVGEGGEAAIAPADDAASDMP